MPVVDHHDYAAARQGMINEILNSNSLETYLIVSNKLYSAPRVTVMHSLFHYIRSVARMLDEFQHPVLRARASRFPRNHDSLIPGVEVNNSSSK